MTLGEILIRTLRIYRTNWRVFLQFSLVLAVIHYLCATIGNTWLTFNPPPIARIFQSYSTRSIILSHVEGFSIVLLQFLIYPTLITVTTKTILQQKITFAAALKIGIQRPVALVTQSLLLSTVFYSLTSILFLPFIWWVNLFRTYQYASPTANSAGTILIMIALFVEYFMMMLLAVSFDLNWSVFVFERTSPFKSLKRAWDVIAEGRVRLATIWITLFLISFLMKTLINAVIPHLLMSFPKMMIRVHGLQFNFFYYFAASFPLRFLLAPIYPIALTLIYFDQRIRQEGISFAEILRGRAANATSEADAERITEVTTPDFSSAETHGDAE